MSNRTKTVGFDRTVHLEWLNYVANLSIQGLSNTEININLEEYLTPFIAGKEARRKTRTVLMALWAEPDKNINSFREYAKLLFRQCSRDEYLILHWGLSLAVYPFFGTVATTIGRLFRLQGDVACIQVRRRIVEKLGERETVTRAVQRLFRSFENWHVLDESSDGSFRIGSKRAIQKNDLAIFLIEAVLRTNQTKSGALRTLIESPCLFPFQLSQPNMLALGDTDRIEIIQQGPNDTQIILADH